MSTITPHYRTVQQLLQTQSFSIDEYQREYKWESKHINELLSDLQGKFSSSYKAGDSTTTISDYAEYFLGSIIVSKRAGKSYLIDGQQRITSLTLLLIFLYRTAQEHGLPVVQTIAPLIFSDNLGQPRFNLDIPERLPVIQALFEGASFSPDGKDESVQTMYQRYEDIRQNDLFADFPDAVPHFTYWLMTKVGLIEIATDDDRHAYAIFETMNDRGKPLSPVDMLKAYLLAPVTDVDRRRSANEVWKKQVLDLISWHGVHDAERDSTCIKGWFRAQYAESIRERRAGATDRDWEQIGTVFHRWARENDKRLKLGSEAANLHVVTSEFPFFVRAYQRILGASMTFTKGMEPIFYNAHNDFTWQNTVLLAPLVPTDDDETVRRKMAVTATYLDIWLMRRAVNFIRTGYSTASYAMYLLCRDIRRKPLSELVAILSKRLVEDDTTFHGSSEKGRQGIDAFALNQMSRRYVFHLLARVTAYTETESGRPGSFDSYVDRSGKNPFDIEHIWADRYDDHRSEFVSEEEFQQMRNHVASLLLLPADVNRSLQDKPFAGKLPNYAKQNFFAASLAPSAYEHQPQFAAFRTTHGLPFKPFGSFGKAEQTERRGLLKVLVQLVWSPDRLLAAAK